jgi:hypothetical protein
MAGSQAEVSIKLNGNHTIMVLSHSKVGEPQKGESQVVVWALAIGWISVFPAATDSDPSFRAKT